MLRTEAGQHLWEEISPGDARRREGQRSYLSVSARGECTAGIGQKRFGAEYVFSQDLAGRRQLHRTIASHHEQGATLCLE